MLHGLDYHLSLCYLLPKTILSLEIQIAQLFQVKVLKRLANTQVQSTTEALGEGLHSDSDHNWRHLKNPTNGVYVGTVAIHCPTPTNSESSITKPTSEDSKVERRKVDDTATLSKPMHGEGEGFLQPIQPVEIAEVSVFKARKHISNVFLMGASMLGGILLSKLSNLPLNKLPPKA